jgi:hypothetical protein
MVSNVAVCLVRTQRVGEFHKLKQRLVMKYAQYVAVKTFAQFSLSGSLPFIHCKEHLASVAACHWMRDPQSYHVSCCLFTFSYLLKSFWVFCGCYWLNPITHTLLFSIPN